MLLPATTSDDSEMSFPTITDDAIETPLPNSPEDVTGMFEPTIMTTLEYDLLDIFVTCDGIPKWKPSSTAPYYAADALELAYNDVYKLSSPFDLTDMDFVGQLSQPISWVGGSASTMEFQGRRQVLAESEHLYGEMPEAYHEIGSAFTDNLLAMKDPAFSKVKNCRIESISIA
jgi:hypothetical protein